VVHSTHAAGKSKPRAMPTNSLTGSSHGGIGGGGGDAATPQQKDMCPPRGTL
jgi:hypothetical protein